MMGGEMASAFNAAGYVVHETLNNGTAIAIRSIRPDDKTRIVKAFLGLSPESIYSRFFYAKTTLSTEEVQRLTEIDYVSAVVLVATLEEQEDETIIALGRYVASGQSAELAFTVAEDFQRRGIAARLLSHLAHIARSNGIVRFDADFLEENTMMLAVFRNSGLTMDMSRSDGVVHAKLFLDTPAIG